MGFKDVRARVIAALQSHQYRHEERAGVDEKNLFYTEEVSLEFVIHLLRRCSGYQYEASNHHRIPDLVCHVFTPELRGEQWYVKVYLLAENAVFISVHPS
jgi:hypothetical protein